MYSSHKAELEDLSEPAPQDSAVNHNATNTSSVVQERLQMYEVAHSNAQIAGDSSKSRRLERGLKVSALLHNFTASTVLFEIELRYHVIKHFQIDVA